MVNKGFITSPSINRVFPCKGCTDREVGCHSKCEKYINARKQYDEEKEKEKGYKSVMINEGDFLGDGGHSKNRRWKHRRK